MTRNDLKTLLDYEEPEKVQYVPGTKIESVDADREKLIYWSSRYTFVISQDEIALSLSGANKKVFNARLLECFKDTDNPKRALYNLADKLEKEPIYKSFGNTLEEAGEAFSRPIFEKAEYFVDMREPAICKYMLPYISDMLIAGMRAKYLVACWIRANLYGFSVEPFAWKEGKTYGREEAVDFPYRSVSDMPKKDKEAFEKLVLDVYRIIQRTSFDYLYHELGKPASSSELSAVQNGEPAIAFKPYPKDGLEKAKYLDFLKDTWQYEGKTDEEILDDNLQYWYGEIAYYLPVLIHRYDEAIYYALKYVGDEYKDYLASLNVEEDWNAVSELKYNDIMKKEE